VKIENNPSSNKGIETWISGADVSSSTINFSSSNVATSSTNAMSVVFAIHQKKYLLTNRVVLTDDVVVNEAHHCNGTQYLQ